MRTDECDPLSARKHMGKNGMESALLPKLLTAVMALPVMAARPAACFGMRCFRSDSRIVFYLIM